jgi:hypothetical protein
MIVKRYFILLLICIIIILFSLNSYATDYYVATNGVDISSRDGTINQPWATIPYAVNQLPVTGGDTIIVRDGLYEGSNYITKSFDDWITIKAENDFGAKLTNVDNGNTVVYIVTKGDANIIFEGFIISNAGTYSCPNGRESEYVIHIESTNDVILENNIIYGNNAPGLCNEIIKINSEGGSGINMDRLYYPHNIQIRRNIIYDPASAGGADIIDSVKAGELDIYENIFFSRGSGESQSFITVKSHVADIEIPDQFKPGRIPRHKIFKNIFLNWDGSNDQAFIQFGEDDKDWNQITNSLIENNLMIGNSNNNIAAAIQLKGVEKITVRANTVVGDLPGGSYGFRIGTETNNPDLDGFYIYNNIFSDPTGTMSRFGKVYEAAGSVSGIELDNNLFWNNGNDIPEIEGVLPSSDQNRIIGNPLINEDQDNIVLPVWDEINNEFLSGSTTIREEFERLVESYGSLTFGSSAIDSANQDDMPEDDILGNLRDDNSDIGAYEYTGSKNECEDWENNHPEWIWCDSFDDGTDPNNNYYEHNDDDGEFQPMDEDYFSPPYSMRALFQLNETSAGGLIKTFGRTPSSFSKNSVRTNEDFREVYWRVYLKHEGGWQGSPGKLSRARSWYRNDGNWGECMLAHWWSSGEVLCNDPVSLIRNDNTCQSSGVNHWSEMDWLGSSCGQKELFSDEYHGNWICIEGHVKLNDPGVSNGFQEFWINNEFDVRSNNLNYVKSWDDYAINAVSLENWWNEPGSIKEQTRYFDNWIISTERIGCIGYQNPNPNPDPEQCTSADSDSDGEISNPEMDSYIESWIDGDISLVDLFDAIEKWKNDCN